jgi:HEAT repeat protein
VSTNYGIKDYQVLLPYLESSSKKIIAGVLNALSNFKNDIVFKKLLEYLNYNDFEVKNASADALFKIKGGKALEFLIPYNDDSDLKEIIREYLEIYEE